MVLSLILNTEWLTLILILSLCSVNYSIVYSTNTTNALYIHKSRESRLFTGVAVWDCHRAQIVIELLRMREMKHAIWARGTAVWNCKSCWKCRAEIVVLRLLLIQIFMDELNLELNLDCAGKYVYSKRIIFYNIKGQKP